MAKRSARKTPAVDARRSSPGEADVSADLNDRIARRAFELFEARGQVHGHDLEDWLRAEQDVRSRDRDVEGGRRRAIRPKESQVDQTLSQSFPASDPPSWTAGNAIPSMTSPEEPVPTKPRGSRRRKR